MTGNDGRGRAQREERVLGSCPEAPRILGSVEPGAGKTVKGAVHSATVAKLPSPCEQPLRKSPLPSLNPSQRVLRILDRESLPWSL